MEGDYKKAGLGAADTAAGAALMSGAGPLAAAGGLWLGGRAAQDLAQEQLDKRPQLADAIGGTINQLGLKTGLWGVDDSAYLQQKAAAGDIPDGSFRSLFATSPDTPPNAQPQAQPALPQAAQAQLGQTLPVSPAPNPIIREGNSYSGTNVGPGAPIYQRGANGQLSLRDAGYVPSGIDSGAASAQRVADIYQSMLPQNQGMPRAPTALHSGNSWSARNNLRNLEVSASSMTNNPTDVGLRGRGRGQPQGDSPAVAAYKAAFANDLKLQGQQPELDLETAKSNNTLRGNLADAQARQYAADQGLRGSMYGANMTAATARYKADDEAVLKQNELDITNADRARKQVTIYGPDGKPDEGATEQAVKAMDSAIPGYSTMGEQARKQRSGEFDALFDVYKRLREQKEMGLGQAIFGNHNPGLEKLPDLKGGKLQRQWLEGVLPGQAGAHGYYVEMPDGRQLKLGQGLSAGAIKAIEHNLATGEWAKKGGR